MERIVLIGCGGHCKVVIDALINGSRYSPEGIVDAKLNVGDELLGVRVLGDDNILPKLFKKGVKNAFITVGSIGDCRLRKALYRKIKNIGFEVPVIIHPKAVIGKKVVIGEGTFVAASATVNSGTKIGKNAIINTSSSIDHDCKIGDFVHLAPGVTLSGGVKVGKETHIGTGANVIQYLNIGKYCMVAAGTTVRSSIEDGKKSDAGSSDE